jgi:hypothetical protein
MKNIHLLPASKQEYQVKEGGLFINDTRKHSWGKLEALICERVTQHGHAWNGTGIRTDICHLYITSDEEIKEGDWYYRSDYMPYINKDNNDSHGMCDCKKIILTTDQDLIADGVQAIDDEFLEWFVKNPNCEYVEAKISRYKHYYKTGEIMTSLSSTPDFSSRNMQCEKVQSIYKIIIPQEEHKQEFDRSKYIAGIDPIVEETLEEAAERFTSKYYSEEGYERDIEEAVKFGAKWQAERMYSEAIEFAEWIRIKDFQTTSKNNWIGLDMKYYTTQELFEQFKKK